MLRGFCLCRRAAYIGAHRYGTVLFADSGSGTIEEQTNNEDLPVMSGLLLAVVLILIGLGAFAMLVLAAAAVVFR